MKIKLFSLILTLLLLGLGAWFFMLYYQVCFQCDPAAGAKGQPDVVLACINVVFAIFAAYLITRKRFNACVIISGIAIGLQAVMIGTVIILK